MNQNLEIEFQKYIVVQSGNSINDIKDDEFEDFARVILESEGKEYEVELTKYIDSMHSEATNHVKEPVVQDSKKNTTFDLSKARNLLPDHEVAFNRHFSDVSDLINYRKELIQSLILQNVHNYNIEIKRLASQLPQPTSGPIISVILHDGNRIERIFDESEIGKDLYIWVASAEPMIKEHITLGEFIIVHADGSEIDPNEPLSSPLSISCCYNVKLF